MLISLDGGFFYGEGNLAKLIQLAFFCYRLSPTDPPASFRTVDRVLASTPISRLTAHEAYTYLIPCSGLRLMFAMARTSYHFYANPLRPNGVII